MTLVHKDKILGRNAARLYGVDVATARCTLADDGFAAANADWRYARRTQPSPVQPFEVSMGPRTRREFLRLWQGNRGIPG